MTEGASTDLILEAMRFELSQVEACWYAYNNRGVAQHSRRLAEHYKDLEQALARGGALPTQWTGAK